MNEYIDNLATQFNYVNTVSIGKSYEKRDMRVIQISKAGSGAPNIFIEAGIHAREWISPAMATYLIDSLLNNDEDGFKDSLNFHILIRLHIILLDMQVFFRHEQILIFDAFSYRVYRVIGLVLRHFRPTIFHD